MDKEGTRREGMGKKDYKERGLKGKGAGKDKKNSEDKERKGS